jgi:type I restriction enzyme R subunit
MAEGFNFNYPSARTRPRKNWSSSTSSPAPELSDAERVEVKKVSRELLDRLKQLLVINWRQKSSARSQLRRARRRPTARLRQTALRAKMFRLFEHVFESYPERDAGVYAAAV